MIIPFPAGGPTDVYARLYAERLGRELGQPVVTENRGGAGGAIGSLEVSRARPDGYTILFGTASTHALYPLVTRQPQFDVVRDFTTIAELGGGPLCWLAHPSRPASLREFLAAARTANPPLSYGSPGSGTMMHLATELLKQQAGGVALTHVPYRGAAPAMNDLVSGTLALAVNTFGGGLPLHQGGRARMLAVATARRLEAAPDVPTVTEALGLVGFEAVLWHAVFAPQRSRANPGTAFGGDQCCACRSCLPRQPCRFWHHRFRARHPRQCRRFHRRRDQALRACGRGHSSGA